MKYSVIIPAYNEEKRIRETLVLYDDYFRRVGNYEIIVVCDGVDRTAEIAGELSAERKHIRLVKFSSRLGKGGGVMKGVEYSKGEYVGFIDADAPVKPRDFFSLFQELSKSDCAIASRRIRGAEVSRDTSLPRRAARIGFNILVNLLFGLGIRDTQCGAKVFRRHALKTIRGMKSTGFEFDVELLWRLKKQGYIITEMPARWSHGGDSKFSLLYGAGMAATLVKIRLGL